MHPDPIDKDDSESIQKMLKLLEPHPSEKMEVVMISQKVNSTRNISPEVLEVVKEEDGLFEN